MLARINDHKTLIVALSNPLVQVIRKEFGVLGTLYVKESDEELNTVCYYDNEDFSEESRIFSEKVNEVELKDFYAKFDHPSDHMSDYTWENHFYGITREEYEQICLDEFLGFYEYVISEDLLEDDDEI